MAKTWNKLHQIVCSRDIAEDARYKEYRKAWSHYSAAPELSPRPLHVDIEITNACNLRCIMCERNIMKREVGYMERDLFCSIIDQCAHYGIYSVKLGLWGESLLHKDFFDMIKYAKSRNIHTQFNTNATLITREVVERLIESGLDRITVSIESALKDSYEGIRCGAEFDAVMNNISDFIRMKPLGRKPLLTVQFIKMKKNMARIPEFVEMFKDKVDFVSVTNVSSTCGDPKILKESTIDYSTLEKIPCSEIRLRLSVLWNGDVTVCCNDFDGFLKIGNVKTESLMDLWHGEKANAIREKHTRRDFSGLICDVCSINRKF